MIDAARHDAREKQLPPKAHSQDRWGFMFVTTCFVPFVSVWRWTASHFPRPRPGGAVAAVFVASCALLLTGCEDLEVRDTASLLVPRLHRSEIVGIIAGMGTTFAALPDLIHMLRSRSSAGMNPRMAGITGVFQILWVYYGLLILSRPVIVWNTIGILINLTSVAVHYRLSTERRTPGGGPSSRVGA
jgi:uncharacterized protein with PQ loop repeat